MAAVVSVVLLPAIFLSYLIIALSQSTPSITPQIGTESSSSSSSSSSCGNHHNPHFITELQQLKLKIARLESVLEETTQDLKAKSLYLKESEKLIEEMSNEMTLLQSALSSLKGESSHANERLNQLEEEVRLLWATLRTNNFEIHVLESKAQDADKTLELVTSQVETMAAIVTEQWIQIQQLEQALHIAEMRSLTVKRQVSSTRCTFLKFVRNLFDNHLQKLKEMLDPFLFDKESALGAHVSHALHQLERILSAIKNYHHELQGFIKQEMEKNEFTAALANQEVVFLVASALITFPLMSAWMLLSSQFS